MRSFKRRTLFKGRLVRFELLWLKMPRGQTVRRELVRHPGAAVIIPRTMDGKLILVRQFRVAVGRKLWEFPAGTLEKGESPLKCAQRELVEETGYRPGRLKKIMEYFPTPGISTEKMYLYLADCLTRAASRTPDRDEDLDTRNFSTSQVERMICRGQIVDGKTILGFLFFQKYLQRP